MLRNTWADPSIQGWRHFSAVQAHSFYVTDMGAIAEIGRERKRGPLRALYHTDPTRCTLTGKIDTPLKYNPRRGKLQYWSLDDYYRVASMIAIQEKYRGLGFCALSRCLELAKIMIAVYRHDQESLGARAPDGLLLLRNITQQQWDQAMESRDAKKDSMEERYYGGVAVLASMGVDEVGAELVALSTLPAGFDKQTFANLTMYGYALAFGYDPSEFWPVQFGSLGRGTEAEMQHQKATGKGGLAFVLAYQEQIQELLPDTLQFEFEQRDDAGRLTEAEVQMAYLEIAREAYKAGLPEGAPLVSREEARSMLAEAGVIPREWTEVEEDVEATDTEEATVRQLRQMVMESSEVRRAILRFPNEPIIRYSWPTGRETVLWDYGRDALTRSIWQVVKRQADDDSEVLYRAPDGDFTITEADVTRAIDTGRRRVGEEFAELLTAQTDIEGEEGNDTT